MKKNPTLVAYKFKIILQSLILFVILLIFTGVFYWPVSKSIHAAYYFQPTHCTILDKKLEENWGGGQTTYRPNFLVSYQIANKNYSLWTYDINQVFSSTQINLGGGLISYSDSKAHQSILQKFTVGQSYPCWYDPQHPNVAVLNKDIMGFFFIGFIISCCLVLGIIILYILIATSVLDKRILAAMQEEAEQTPK